MLDGKVALVTGSTRGIGLAIAKEFGETGATVIICSRSEKKAKELVAQLKGRTDFAGVDVTSDASVGKLMKKVLSTYGHIDILVNNAGYPFQRKIWYKPFHEIKTKDLRSILEVDTVGTVRMAKAVVNSMKSSHRGGVIVNISSTPAISGHIEGAPYTMAKAAVVVVH